MKSHIRHIASAVLLLLAARLDAQVYPNGSVSTPGTFVGVDVTFTRNGSTPHGFAWSEATLWKPSGDYVLGNEYTALPYTQTVSGSTMLNQGVGTYTIQYRLVDLTYNYADQWIPINVLTTYSGSSSNSNGGYIQIQGSAYLTEGNSSTATTVVIGDSPSNYYSYTTFGFAGTAQFGVDYVAYCNQPVNGPQGYTVFVNSQVTTNLANMYDEVSLQWSGDHYSFQSNPITIVPLNNPSFGTTPKTLYVQRANLPSVTLILQP